MPVVSMTGFARAEHEALGIRVAWEIKSVNGKGLDLRFRLPAGMDGLEAQAKALAQAAFSRGSISLSLSIKRPVAPPVVRINQPVLDAVVAAMAEASRNIDAAAPRLDGLFAIKGVLEIEEPEEDEASRETIWALALTAFEQAVAACSLMRQSEGAVLAAILEERLAEIARLTAIAEAHPARAPAAIREKLATSIKMLTEASPALDPDRLHQEAILLAAKADIREELDRLVAHVAQARALLKEGGAIGRKLDFLAQEFNRETNTLCSKANDVALTGTGLALKTVVEQFREQVQNIE